MKRIILFTFLFIVFISSTVHAQNETPKWSSGLGLNFAFPIGDYASYYNFGWGAYSSIDYNITKVLAARFDFGWTQFSGDDYVDDIQMPYDSQLDVLEFTGGLRAKLAFVYAEFRGGYYTGVKSWGYVPAVGLRLGKLDIQGNLNVVDDNHWWAFRAVYYWGHM
ncbi:MAG: hypothetical protein GXO47_07995 [Chlorobi bacterium]|nr:hypothetical protein [Chlorobiota bacterium]